MHSTKVTLIADQTVSFKSQEINVHHIQSIVIDENFSVVEIVKKSPDTICREEIELAEKLKTD